MDAHSNDAVSDDAVSDDAGSANDNATGDEAVGKQHHFWRILGILLTSLVLALLVALWFWYGSDADIQDANQDLRDQGLAVTWQEVVDRQVSSTETLHQATYLAEIIDDFYEHHSYAILHPDWHLGRLQDDDGGDIDALRAHHQQLDAAEIRDAMERLKAWPQQHPGPLVSHARPSWNMHPRLLMEFLVNKRLWARFVQERVAASDDPAQQAEALHGLLYSLHLRGETTIIGVLVEISILAIAIETLAEHPAIWPSHGQALLAHLDPWMAEARWQSELSLAFANELRYLNETIEDNMQETFEQLYGNDDPLTIRLTRAELISGHGELSSLFARAPSLQDALVESWRYTDRLYEVAKDSYWPWGPGKMTNASALENLAYVGERAITLLLRYRLLRHEMGLEPWPADPFASAGQGLRKEPASGPVERCWSVGRNGRDDGGEDDDLMVRYGSDDR